MECKMNALKSTAEPLAHMHMPAFRRKMAYGLNRDSAGSLQWSDFRTLPDEYVTEFSVQTDTPELRCDLTHTQTQLL